MSQPARIALIVVAVIVVIIGAAVIVLESGIPRRIAESTATAKLGRPVKIGALHIGLFPPLGVTIRDLTIANVEGGSEPNMVELARGDVRIDPWKLLTGRLDVLLVTADKPKFLLEKNQEGKGNWQFGDPNKPATDTAPNFPVRKLVVNEGRATYRDPKSKIDVNIGIQSQPGENGGVDRLILTGDGKVANTDFKLNGKADTVLNLQNKDQPYAVEMEVKQGDNNARLAGTLKEPLRFEGLAADLHIEAKNAYDLYQLTGVAIPPTPPYTLEGKLFREGNVWRMDPMVAKVGQSDLRGKVAFDVGKERPKLDADLTSQRLRFPDFGGFVGANVDQKESGVQQVQKETEKKQAQGRQPAREPPKTSSEGTIPDTEIDFERLKAMDAHVRFRGTRVESPIVPVKEVATEITLDNGLLRVRPLRFGIGDGKIDFTLALDGRSKPAKIDAVMSLTRVPVSELLRTVEAKMKQYQTSTGTIGGRAQIKGRGNSPKALLASTNGDLGLAMEDGQIGAIIIELFGIDIAESVGILAEGNKPVPLRCFIAEFEFIDGIMGSKAFVIDTTDTNITGEGAVNFRDERVDFRMVPHPKDFSPLTARTPINISGSLGAPKIRPETAPLVARLGLATALSAALTPLAAPLAFIDVGLGKDSDCGAFVQEVRARIEKQKQDGGSQSGAPTERRQNRR
jgi:AsmA family protein